MKFVVRIFHFVEVVHTYVMSSVSESLDIKRRKNVVVVHSWEDRSHGSLLNSFNFVRQVTNQACWCSILGRRILVRVGLLTCRAETRQRRDKVS